VQFEMPAFSQSRSNAAAGGYDARKRGANIDHHKTGIDALLNPKHAGAQPYRLVLGEVWKDRACIYIPIFQRFFASSSLTGSCHLAILRSPENSMQQMCGKRHEAYSNYSAGSHPEVPPCHVAQVRQRLIITRRRMEDLLAGNQPSDTADCYETTEELAAPLLACYWSLWDCGAWGGFTVNAVGTATIQRIFMSDMQTVCRFAGRCFSISRCTPAQAPQLGQIDPPTGMRPFRAEHRNGWRN